MKNRQAGSIKNKIVATELLEERANCNFDQKELKRVFMSIPEEVQANIQRVMDDIENDPELNLTHKYYEMTR